MSSKNGSSSVVSLLDLPESPLENILQRLSAVELCIMSQVSTHLYDRCTADYLWENILKQKWSNLIGYVARQEWNLLVESRKTRKPSLIQHKHNGTLGSFRGVWPSLFLGSYLEDSGHQPNSSRMSDHDSVKALYISLEKGRFWFPAQAYTRAGSFVMYCYDVLLSYDSRTNTFRSRYRHDGWRKIEENIPWDRVKATLVESPPDVLHQWDSLDDLVPGDHIEVQWRRAKGIPYDWWYATVGHLGSCTGNEHRCHCRNSDMLMVEFKQYSVGSPYRQVVLNKNGHDEQIVGGGGGGCYGGIRKLRREEEIARWKMIFASANSNSRGAPPVAAIAPYYYNV